MKKFLFFIFIWFLVSCDPEHVFVESQEHKNYVESVDDRQEGFSQKTLSKSDDMQTRKEIKSITYKDHEYLVVFYSTAYGVDVEIVEIKD